MEVMKCEHERAVHLFVDSLMNRDHMSFAFQCTDPTRFRKGICLSCRKNRCNNIGYNARKMRKRRNSKMYLKTRADTPFGGEPLAVMTYNLSYLQSLDCLPMSRMVKHDLHFCVCVYMHELKIYMVVCFFFFFFLKVTTIK